MAYWLIKRSIYSSEDKLAPERNGRIRENEESSGLSEFILDILSYSAVRRELHAPAVIRVKPPSTSHRSSCSTCSAPPQLVVSLNIIHG